MSANSTMLYTYKHTSNVIIWVFLQQTFEQWKIVFWILSVLYTIGALIYLIFGTAITLSWNSIQTEEETKDIQIEELEIKSNH